MQTRAAPATIYMSGTERSPQKLPEDLKRRTTIWTRPSSTRCFRLLWPNTGRSSGTTTAATGARGRASPGGLLHPGRLHRVPAMDFCNGGAALDCPRRGMHGLPQPVQVRPQGRWHYLRSGQGRQLQCSAGAGGLHRQSGDIKRPPLRGLPIRSSWRGIFRCYVLKK